MTFSGIMFGFGLGIIFTAQILKIMGVECG